MKLKVAAIQMDIKWEDVDANLNHLNELIDPLVNCDLIVLPEAFPTGFTMDPAKVSSQKLNSVLQWMQIKANEKCAVITGSLPYPTSSGYYNRLVWQKPTGARSFYDKRHLFHIEGEKKNYLAGKTKLIETISNWRVCPMICYDVRFPVWSRYQGDYDVLIYVANWPAPRRDIWITLLKARAIENQCFVVGVNRIGDDCNGINYCGDTLIINPKGEVVEQAESNQEAIVSAELSLNELTQFREKFPVWTDSDNFTLQ